TSASAHFCTFPVTTTCSATDVGKRISGGSIPDGATIATVNSTSSVVIACTGCLPSPAVAIAGISAASNFNMSIEPLNPTSSTRVVTDAHFLTTTSICSVSAKFSASDRGLAVAPAPGSPDFTGTTVGQLRISATS